MDLVFEGTVLKNNLRTEFKQPLVEVLILAKLIMEELASYNAYYSDDEFKHLIEKFLVFGAVPEYFHVDLNELLLEILSNGRIFKNGAP